MRLEPVFEKAWEQISRIVSANQLLVVLAVVSGGLLFDFLALNARFGIEESVLNWKLWIVITFYSSLALLIFGAVNWLLSRVSAFRDNYLESAAIDAIEINEGSRLLLFLCDERSPDSLSLLVEHPDVRQLRRYGLVESSFAVRYDGFSDYRISERGSKLLSRLPRPQIPIPPNETIIKYVKELTGLEFKPERFQTLS